MRECFVVRVTGGCYLTTHSLNWLWRAVWKVEAAGHQPGCSESDCSLHSRLQSRLYGALWAQAHLRAAHSDVHAVSSYSTIHGSPDGEEDWRQREQTWQYISKTAIMRGVSYQFKAQLEKFCTIFNKIVGLLFKVRNTVIT